MKRNLIIAGVVIALIAIVVASVFSGQEDGKRVYAETVEVRAIEAVVSAPGQIDPKVKVNISAHVIGKIEKLHFDEGDYVEKGDRLVELERVALEAQRDRMSSELASRQIELRRAQINLEQTELDFRRAESLRSEGIQAEDLYEQARLAWENAKANLAAAREAVRQARAALTKATDDLERTTILAPIDGKVVELNAREGEVVITGTMNNPGSVIAVLADLSEVLVEAEVGETEVVEVEEGQPVRVEVDAVPDDVYEGRVVEIGSSATASGAAAGIGLRFFNVKVLLADPDDRLRPGMTAQVEIITSSRENVLTVPVQSVLERDLEDDETEEEVKVVPVVEDDVVDLVPVETGISDATHVEIVSGLEGGETIVTGPFRTLTRLEEGDHVTIREEDEETSDEEEEGDE
ncbi:MAG: efflux RND transporter periplasmic adaptor subunit [Thermoanaerobaculia bacterium]|nr:efflux RND transporter periplasmic adaptor subunit [Thermoanaerobaculia bacterium]